MSRYSGMSVEDSIAAYQQDSGDEQKAQAECEQYAAEITERNIVELRETGFCKMVTGITWSLNEIMAAVEPEFFACEMCDIENYFKDKETFMPKIIEKAVKKAELWIYNYNYKNLVKS